VSVTAAVQGQASVALGNVIGSNLLNILLILGLGAVISPLNVARSTLHVDAPVMLASTGAVWAFVADGRIGRVEGLLLAAALVAFTAAAWRLAVRAGRGRAESPSHEASGPALWRSVMGVALAIALLGVGARLLVVGAVDLANTLGVSERVIGLTLVALGTSLPELVTTAVAAWRRQADIAVSNVIGSNIFNALGVLGATAWILPLPVEPAMSRFDTPLMAAVSALLLPILWTGRRVSRPEGALLLGGAAGYTAWLALA
jgi:cation:H+ antiporter